MRQLLPVLLLLSGCATMQSAEVLESPAGKCVQADPAKQCCGPAGSPAVADRYGAVPCDEPLRRAPPQLVGITPPN